MPRRLRAHKNSEAKLSDKQYEARTRALHALARMRRDSMSIQAASKEEGTTPATVKKYLPAALRRSKSGHWIATKSDRYVRLLSLPGAHGPVIVRARGSKEAQFASAYLASLSRWARTEKPYELASFHGKKVGGFELITASRNDAQQRHIPSQSCGRGRS